MPKLKRNRDWQLERLKGFVEAFYKCKRDYREIDIVNNSIIINFPFELMDYINFQMPRGFRFRYVDKRYPLVYGVANDGKAILLDFYKRRDNVPPENTSALMTESYLRGALVGVAYTHYDLHTIFNMKESDRYVRTYNFFESKIRPKTKSGKNCRPTTTIGNLKNYCPQEKAEQSKYVRKQKISFEYF